MCQIKETLEGRTEEPSIFSSEGGGGGGGGGGGEGGGGRGGGNCSLTSKRRHGPTDQRYSSIGPNLKKD